MLSPGVARRVIDRFTAEDRTIRRQEALDRLTALTDRGDVLVEIGQGRSNAEIAAGLFVKDATIKSHITHPFEKLAATNRDQLAIAAFRAGLID